jgi:AcrR family transcriptional regulator
MTDRLRADARRNYDLLLAAASSAFAEHGTDASLRDIARQAGVGIGTLYRHFATREALLEALLRDQFDNLREKAESLLAERSPSAALLAWLHALAGSSATYRGVPESVMGALNDEESELHASCVAMRAAGGHLLARAQQAGEARQDVTANELLAVTAGVAWASQQSSTQPAMVDRLLLIAMHGFAITPNSSDSEPR